MTTPGPDGPEAARNAPSERGTLWWVVTVVASVALAFNLLFVASLVRTTHLGTPWVSDFMPGWVAASYAVEGSPRSAYEVEAIGHRERSRVSASLDVVHPWLYPPNVLLLVLPLGLLAYHRALVVWLTLQILACGGVLRAITRHRSLWFLYLAFPGLVTTISFGQNGLLSAAFLGAALLALDRRPWLAGVLFTLFAYKPHLAFPVPLVLLAAWHLRTLASCVIATATWLGVTTLVFGTGIWWQYRQTLAEHMRWYGSGRLLDPLVVSTYGAGKLAGLSPAWAQALQVGVALAVLGAVIWLWRRQASPRRRNAALVLACLLAGPKVVCYDLAMLALVIAWLHEEEDLAGWETGLLALAWFLPLLAPVLAGWSGLQVAPLVLGGLLFSVLRRQHRELALGLAASPE